ncbi:hypothetical protein Tco_0200966 [Tanacetum coccineum]
METQGCKWSIRHENSVGASSGAQNLAFITAPSTSSTNDVNTAKPTYEVSTFSPNVNTASPQDLEQIHEDDLEAMDLKWKLSLLSMRAKRLPRNKEGQLRNQDNTRKHRNNEDTSSKEMLVIDGVDDSKKNSDESLVEEQVLQDTSSFVESSLNVDKETVFPVDKKINCDHHQRKGIVSRNNYNRVDYDYYAKTTHPSIHRNMTPKAVLLKTGLTSLNTVRPVNTAHPKSAVQRQVNAVREKGVNVVKTSACWVWRPTKPNGASLAFKIHNYIDPQQDDKGFVDSGCSRHMTGNIAYLSNARSAKFYFAYHLIPVSFSSGSLSSSETELDGGVTGLATLLAFVVWIDISLTFFLILLQNVKECVI